MSPPKKDSVIGIFFIKTTIYRFLKQSAIKGYFSQYCTDSEEKYCLRDSEEFLLKNSSSMKTWPYADSPDKPVCEFYYRYGEYYALLSAIITFLYLQISVFIPLKLVCRPYCFQNQYVYTISQLV
jgi:hypothetical protein